MPYANYVPIFGTILNIVRGSDCCSQLMSLRTNDGIVNFVVGAQTKVIDDRRLRVGMRVAAFYDSSQPVLLIFPPQYRALLVTALGRNEQVTLNFFDRNLTAEDNSLQINVAGNTMVRTANGQEYRCNLANQILLVYYTMTTRSIPPQTTPSKIIVMC